MPERFELRIAFRKLLIGTLLTIIPMSLAGLYFITQANNSLEETIGSHYQTMARITAAEVSGYIEERVLGVALLASEPALVSAVKTANQTYTGMTDDAIAARMKRMDDVWNTGQASAEVTAMLASPASRLLLRAHQLDPRVLRITVTDAKGGTVAATHKSMDFYQADEDYWKNIYSSGRGATSLTDVLYDDATHAHYIGVGVPILEPETNRFIGTLDALVNVNSLAPIVNRAQLGGTGRVLLVKGDGAIITGAAAGLTTNRKSEEHAALIDAHAGVEKPGGHHIVQLSGPVRTLIAHAGTGLKVSYPALDWTVLIAQDTREAFAPIRSISRMIWLFSLLGLTLVALLAAYFSLHRRMPITAIRQHEVEAAAETQPR
ncbi:MAG: cache domain-containing protein [Acidobacteria bacterium]|nr:cache domain-containing protein [Acidobacteriota bacterium]